MVVTIEKSVRTMKRGNLLFLKLKSRKIGENEHDSEAYDFTLNVIHRFKMFKFSVAVWQFWGPGRYCLFGLMDHSGAGFEHLFRLTPLAAELFW